jgi:hypothetical protein
MRLIYAVVSDFALVSADGKPTIVGVFDTIRAQTVPFVWARFAFAARLESDASEAGSKYNLQIVIRDPNGTEMARAGGPFQVPPTPPGVPRVYFDPQIIFDGFTFPALGTYTLTLEANGVPLATVAINVIQIAQA